MRVIRSLLASALLCCATASPCLAAGDEAPSESAIKDARALAYQGQEAYEAGRYEQAVEAARAAQRLVAAPTLSLLEARSLRQLGRLLEARAQYRMAASPLPSHSSEAFHLARQAALAELLSLEDELPYLVLELRSSRGDTPRPQVTVDGARWSSESFGVWVAQDPGEHVVEAAFGARIERHVVRLAPRDRQRLLLGAPVDDGSKLRAPLAISAFGVSAIGLGAGIGFAVHGGNLRNELDASCPEGICPQSRADTLRNYRTVRDLSTAGYVVSAVGAATGVIVLALPTSKRRETGTPSLTVGAGALHLGGGF